MKNCLIALTLVCPCLMFIGCGPAGTIVEGKVMLSDGTAAPRGAVMLNGPNGRYTGKINPDGTYTMRDPVLDGTYKVAVTGVNDRDAVGDGMQYEGGAAEAGEGEDTPESEYEAAGEYVEEDPSNQPQSLIEDKYTNPSISGITMTVPSENYDITVEAKKK